jgi:predicted flap endonuclease-1-like 5' DNA nuclease
VSSLLAWLRSGGPIGTGKAILLNTNKIIPREKVIHMARKQSRIHNTAPPIKADDFRLIRGIGPVVAGRLYDVGVCTYKQLAHLSPAKLAEMVPGLSSKQISKQDWRGQARKLATKNTQPKPSPKDSPKRSISQHYENFTVEYLVDEKHAVRRTRAVHIQSGDADTWAGWEARQLVDFLARHTGVRMAAERPEKQADQADLNRDVQNRSRESQTTESEIRALPPPYNTENSHSIPIKETTPPAPQASELSIRKIEVLTPGSDHPINFLRQDQPYLVRLTLDLTEVNESGDLPIHYKASVFCRQLGGTRHTIGEIVSPLKFSKSVNLDINGDCLPPGTYRLEAFAEVRYDEATPGPTASLKGGLLQVH